LFALAELFAIVIIGLLTT